MAGNVNINVSSSWFCQACGASNPAQATHCLACLEPLSTVSGGTSATTNPLTGLLLPEVIIQQRYRVLDVLSTGTVSTIYKAEDIQLGNRMVTLKEIGKNNQNTQEALASIEAGKREMLLLASLIHPNLPRIYDYFVENHRWYFVMDFLDGETLEAYLREKKYRPLPVEEVLDSGLQLLAVLDYLHIHQSPLDPNDLTLRNIWRTPDGKLYLLDTGIASSTDVMPASSSISSLGKILRQLQTGKTSSRSRLHLALPKLHKRSRHPQSWELEALIRQMVHRDVSKRPYTVGIVKQELQHLTSQLLPQQKSAFSRRTLLRMAGYAGLVAATGALTWVAESRVLGGPHPDYSPNLGGTFCTYNTGNGVLGVAWSPNGMRLVMGNWQGHVQAFAANTGLNSITFQAPDLQNRVEDVKWLPGGNAIAACGDDSIVWVWNAATGKLQRTYREHTNWVISLACSPDGKYIASGSFDTTVRVWEVATGRTVVIYGGHSDKICSVAWSPDGSYIASASYDSTVQIWEAATGRPVYTYSGNEKPVYTVAWSTDGQRIASGDAGGKVLVWPVALFESDGQQQEQSVVPYNQDASAYDPQHDGAYDSQHNAVQAVAWSPDNRYVASVAHDVQIFDSFTGRRIYTYTKHDAGTGHAVQAVAWSPNGRYIASGGMEGSVQVWNAKL
jgi:Tol biopolymer transport system component/tRNA A-37 threonylcarbamoyl transferase component Bud32